MELIAQYGLALVFVNVLLERAGLPLPATPTLLICGSFGGHRPALRLVHFRPGTARLRHWRHRLVPGGPLLRSAGDEVSLPRLPVTGFLRTHH